MEHPTDSNCILEACYTCKVIHMYNIDTGKGKIVYKDCIPHAMCHGPDDSVLVWDGRGNVLQLKWNCEERQLGLITKHHTKSLNGDSMCYIKDIDVLVMLGCNDLQAVNLSDGSILWTEKNKRDILKAWTVTCGSDGRVYVCSDAGKLSIIDPFDGDVLQQIELEDLGSVTAICWTPSQQELRVLDRGGKIRCYDVKKDLA